VQVGLRQTISPTLVAQYETKEYLKNNANSGKQKPVKKDEHQI